MNVHCEMQEGEWNWKVVGRKCPELQVSGTDFGDFISSQYNFIRAFPNMLYFSYRLWNSVPFHGSYSSHQSQTLQAGW